LKRSSAIGLLILTGILWSTGGFMVKMIPWPPLVIAGIRSGITAIVIYLYDKPERLRFGKYTVGGAVCYTVMVIFYVLANKMTTAGNAILIQYTAPVYVAIFGLSFLGEKSSKKDWMTIVLMLVGLGLFFFEGLSFTSFWGNIAALIAGFGFAGTTLFMRKQKNGRPIDSVLLGNILTFLICVPFLFQDVTFEMGPWIRVTYLGVIQLGLAYILYSTAIKHVSALDSIIYPVIEPVFNPILAFLFLGELMSGNAQFGGALVLAGVLGRGLIQAAQNKKIRKNQ
jgi:drug/metabolite transporter (DMT)-like permease